MAKSDIITTKIPNINTPWNNYTGQRVEEFIKEQLTNGQLEKVGYLALTDQPKDSTATGDGYYSLMGFADEESYTSWHSEDNGYNPETQTNTNPVYAALCLFRIIVPIKEHAGYSYYAYLTTSQNTSNTIVVTKQSYEVPVLFRSFATSEEAGSDNRPVTEGTITIQRTTTTGTWETVGTEKLVTREYKGSAVPQPSEYVGDTINIGKYFREGLQQVRIRASYSKTSDTGAVIGSATSSWVTFDNVTYTQLSVEFANTSNCSTILNASTGVFPVSLEVNGDIEKTIHVSITGSNGTEELSAVLPASTKTWTHNFTDTNSKGILSHGVHTVSAYVTCSDGQTANALSSETVMTQRMVLNSSTPGVDMTQPFVMVQGLKTEVVNYVAVNPLLQYAVWIPSSTNHFQPSTTQSIDLQFVVSAGQYADSLGMKYMSIDAHDRTPGNLYSLNGAVIEAESESGETGDEITGYFHILDVTDPSQVTDILYNSAGVYNYEINIDNRSHFEPSRGAEFFMNPKSRDNSETNPLKVYNEADNHSEVVAEFTNFSAITDGWLVNQEDNQRVLRIRAGQQLVIHHDWLAGMANLTPEINSSVTLEIDFKTKNVTDETSPIFQAASTLGDNTKVGVVLSPMYGYVASKNYKTTNMQDFSWQEDERTHIVINIQSKLTSDNGTLPVCRVYINGKINREFLFGTRSNKDLPYSYESDEWTGQAASVITIGQAHADIDVYNIRAYNSANTSKGSVIMNNADILQNYISSLPTVEQKLKVKQENDIFVNNVISKDRLIQLGKNCLIWHGIQPTHSDQDGSKGYWEVLVFNEDGTPDPEHSGTLGKYCGPNMMSPKRQGTTANTYYYSNIQTKMDSLTKKYDPEDPKTFVYVSLNKIHSDYSYEQSEVITIPQSDHIYGEAGTEGIKAPDGWVDGNGMYHGAIYKVSDNVPGGNKLVLKINYASSQQSHLMGACNLYNDLHTAIVGRNTMQTANSKARVAKPTLPFHYFTQAAENEAPIFQGMGTFGPGKMDDPTWGVNKNAHNGFAMIEGADNNKPLTDFRVPWDSSRITYFLNSDGDEIDGWNYLGEKSFDLDKYVGKNASKVVIGGKEFDQPSDLILGKIKDLVNFMYLHNPMMKGYNGQWSDFTASATEADRDYVWWCNGDYRLRRWDTVENDWVDAGWDAANEEVMIRNIGAPEFGNVYNNRSNYTTVEEMNEALILALATDAKSKFDNYWKKDSVVFHYAFTNSFIAGTDNCSKNTYYVLDPGTLKWECHQDDMDTIFATDNNGFQTKPYYIDREHPCADGSTESLYEGTKNVLFNLVEIMYGDKLQTSGVAGENSEIRAMMYRIFTNMASLVNSETKYDHSVWGCLDKYFFSTQNYFSASAYNEQARIRYEYPTSLGFVSDLRSVVPITQSMGDQLEAEKQYMKRRLVLYGSFAEWGPFGASNQRAGNLGIPDADEGMLSFESTATENGSRPPFMFDLVPHQYIYPVGLIGTTVRPLRTKCAPGSHVSMTLPNDGDTGMALTGSNYYRNFGSFGDFSVKNTFTLNGKRLTTFAAEPSATAENASATPNFRPSSITINAPQLVTLSLSGCTKTGGTIDLSNSVRLQSVNLHNTGIVNVILPETSTLTSVVNPATLYSSSFRNLPNLTTFTFDGYSSLNSINWNFLGNAINSLNLITALNTASVKLNSATVTGINWSASSTTGLDYIAKAKVSKLEGIVTLTGSNIMTYEKKQLYMDLWGNIDDQNNKLYISYPRSDANRTYSVGIRGRQYIFDVTNPAIGDPISGKSTYRYDVIPYGSDGKINYYSNDIEEVTWSYSGYESTQNTIDAETGILTVNATSGDGLTPDHLGTVTCSVKLFDSATRLTASYPVHFNYRDAEVGDYVYADGSWSNCFESDRTVVGICFYVNPSNKNERLCSSIKSLGGQYWGLYNSADYMAGVATDVTYEKYDLQKLINVQGAPLTATAESDVSTDKTYYIRDDNFKDSTQADGFTDYRSEHTSDDFETYTAANTTKTTRYAPCYYGFCAASQDVPDNQAHPSIWATYKNGQYVIETGTRVPWGYLNTLYIINHRNYILDHLVSRTVTVDGKQVEVILAKDDDPYVKIPSADPTTGKTEWQDLSELMTGIGSEIYTYTDPETGEVINVPHTIHYRELYYPAASKCYAFSPSEVEISVYNMKVGETLNSKFATHNWFLPASGDLARMYWYHRHSNDYKSGNVNYVLSDDPAENANRIYAKAHFDMGTTAGTRNFTDFPNSNHWSSTESHSYNSWFVGFNNGYFSNGSKYGGYVVRPVSAF